MIKDEHTAKDTEVKPETSLAPEPATPKGPFNSPQTEKIQPTHFTVPFKDVNDLVQAINDTVPSPHVRQLLFNMINKTFKPVLPS